MSREDEPLWSGRLVGRPAIQARALGRSLAFDVRLAPQEARASLAHVRALQHAGLVSEPEADALAAAIEEIGRAIANGTFAFADVDEDVHSAIERGATERLGDLGARLHAGRSRNDLVITDLRLWLLDAGARIGDLLTGLVGVLVARARKHSDAPMPGTTHGRPAQAVTLGHHLLAHAWPLFRDLERFDGWAQRAAVSPLGAGALATTTLGLDPATTAADLGLPRAFENSIDAVSDRDVVLEFLGTASICAVHLSRLAADLLRWTDPALGWAELAEEDTTGSSMMPQKRNPDVAELSRAKAARIAAGFAGLCAVLQGLPLGYHRDLQEDKEPAFDAVDTLERVLTAIVFALERARFETDAMRRAAADPELFATDLTEALVGAGEPFRDAYRRTGELLRRLEYDGRSLADLTTEEWTSFGLSDGADLLDPDRSIAARSAPGGPSAASVRGQVAAIEDALKVRGA
jgi:argininosuccinate lyase